MRLAAPGINLNTGLPMTDTYTSIEVPMMAQQQQQSSENDGSPNILGNLFGLLGLGAGIAGGGLATASGIDRLQQIGQQAVIGTQVTDPVTGELVNIPGSNQLAQQAIEMSQFQPFTVTTATGGQFGVGSVDPETGQINNNNITMGLSDSEQFIQNMLMGQAEQGLFQGPYGELQRQQAATQAFNLGGDFMGSLADPMATREADVYERIRATQRPEEERQRLALEERLAQQGRLGVRTSMFGGTPEQLALSKAQEEAQNRASLAAIQQAQAEQAQQARLGTQYTGLGSQLAMQDLAAQQAQQQLALGALTGSYIPQNQLLAAQQASQLFPQLTQRGQLFGAGQFGETSMAGLEAMLVAEQAAANLLGGIGSNILGGLFSPMKTADGNIGSLFGSVLSGIFGDD